MDDQCIDAEYVDNRGFGDDCVITAYVVYSIFSDSDDADIDGRTEQLSDYAYDVVYVCIDVLICRQAGDSGADRRGA